MTAHIPPHHRAVRPPLRPIVIALLGSAAVAGAAWAAALAAAPDSFRTPVAAGGGVAALALCAAVVTAAVQAGRYRSLRERVEAHERAVARFVDTSVPRLVERLRGGASAETAIAAVERPADAHTQRVLRTMAEEIARGEATKAAAMAACANAAGRMQALATSMLASLREMEHRHTDEDVLEDLLHLDHRTAQAGRLADSIAVLTGARSGRRWGKPIVMESILRGAMGRIGGYQRVRLHSAVGVAVAGHAAEGVMHALAELMDNAANFSPPNSEVHVYAEEVPAGVVITVEDSGLVMSEVALRRAERAVSSEALDLTTLSGTRLGLAVVGVLARKHGLSVSFRPSARGGTGALLMIPQDLITRPRTERIDDADSGTTRPARTVRLRPSGDGTPQDAKAPAAPGGAVALATAAGRAEPRPTAEHAPAGDGGDPTETGGLPQLNEAGLPKRRRGRTLAKAHPQGLDRPRDAGQQTPPPAESGTRFRTFRQAVQKQGQGQTRAPGADQAATTPPADSPTPSAPTANTAQPEDDTP
ncbi:sensor histidine kinase [Streptomyces millisiae]|uniref:histidine kinase n=1 Tax=Streptomyces millisiae TaxID=3075542 RepID=A0ABU2LRX1_9ACTN|nr:ATP-binding protein [Streptomyces sp. DSM 44918]MDT0320342.1 ATP-binding protein [Streptomyces sp. DSM 44918]